MKSFIKAMCCAFVIAGTLSAQTTTLTTTFASNNGQAGNQFDIVAINDVTVCYFDVNIDAFNPTETIEVYTCDLGSKVGNENNALAWTLIATETVVSQGTNVPTPLTIPLGVQIPAGTTQGFYVTCTTSTNINYTNGPTGTQNTVFSADANIQFLAGSGHSYPFGSLFQPRIWNGNIYYTTGLVTTCPPRPLGAWQANSADLSADINGLPGDGSGPIEFEACAGTQFNANLAGLPNPWEVIVQVAGAAEANLNGALGLNFTENIVNLNPFLPNSLFLGNLAFNGLFAALPTTSFTLGTPGGELDWQVIILNGASADGITLSAANCVRGVASITVPGPTADDTPITVDLTNIIPAGVNYYGANYTSISVMPNGRVGFGAGDTDFNATVAEFAGDEPSLGAWSDFSPNIAGSVTVSYDCSDLLTVSWSGVPYFGQAATSSSFDIIHSVSTGDWTIGNIALGVGDGADALLVGFSAGLPGGATDGGASDFTQAAGAPALATDMIYEFATTDLTGLFIGGGSVNPVSNIVLVGGTGAIWTSN